MKTINEKNLVLQKIWETSIIKNSGSKGINSKKLMEYVGFNSKAIEIGYINQEKKRFRNNAELQSWIDIGFITLKQRKSKGRTQDKAVFASNGIILPLKNEHNEITNLYCIHSLIGNYDYLYDAQGLYPNFPHIDTQILIITESPEDAAALLHTTITNQYVQVISLHKNGTFSRDHSNAISNCKQLKTVILAFPRITNYAEFIFNMLQETLKHVSIQFLEIPQVHTLYEYWKTYENEGLETLYYDFVKNLNQRETSDNSLEIVNDQLIRFEGTEADFEIRGYLPYDLGKMEITLVTIHKTTYEKDRRKIDLFNSEKIQYIVRTLSERSDYNPNFLQSDIVHLTNLLEIYRDRISQQSEKELTKAYKKELTPLAEKKAIEKLKQPNLISLIDSLLEQSGIIGEQNVRLTSFIIAYSYKMPHQLHGIIQGESGSGKTHIIDLISQCMPTEDVRSFSRISEKALQNMTEHELVNTFIIVQDLDGVANDALFALRELQSAGKFSSSVVSKDHFGNCKTITKDVFAKMSSLAATTKALIYYDNLTRSILLGVDESEEQTKRIIDYQNKIKAGIIQESVAEQAKFELRNIVRMLKPYKVINPYADRINVPLEAKMLRRLNVQFHDFIELITLLHQFQRKLDAHRNLIVDKEDIIIAIELFFTPIFLKIDDLDSSTRQFFEKLKMFIGKENYKTREFNQFELKCRFNKSKSQICKCIYNLRQQGYIKISSGTANIGYNYIIRTWDELENFKNKLKRTLIEQLASIS